MSVAASTWAWQQATESSGQRLVLLAVADAASGPGDEQPGTCWPSVAHLSAMTAIGPSTVRQHLERLCEMGLLVKVERRRRANGTLGTWRLQVPYASAGGPAVDDSTSAGGSARPSAGGPAVDQRRWTGALEPSCSEPSYGTKPIATQSGSSLLDAPPMPGRALAKEREGVAQAIARAWWDGVKESTGAAPTAPSFPAVMTMANRAVRVYPAQAVLDALSVLHRDARPITGQTLDALLSGRGRAAPAPAPGRQAPVNPFLDDRRFA